MLTSCRTRIPPSHPTTHNMILAPNSSYRSIRNPTTSHPTSRPGPQTPPPSPNPPPPPPPPPPKEHKLHSETTITIMTPPSIHPSTHPSHQESPLTKKTINRRKPKLSQPLTRPPSPTNQPTRLTYHTYDHKHTQILTHRRIK